MTLITIQETHDLVESSSFAHAKFPFEKFNPVQSGLFPVVPEDANFIVASNTGSGKTGCAEMLMSHAISEGRKVVYLSPLKSLSQQQLTKWTGDYAVFAERKVAICTGDYRFTADRVRELDEANVVIMTSEMLNSTSRNARAEKNQFLQGVGLIVIDESHLIGVAGRGDHLESGIMKFTEANPSARLLLLSATMPNVGEVGQWLSHLNGKKTYLLKTDWRPCKLNIHYERYFDLGQGYDETELTKVRTTLKILKKHPADKFICFVHSKKTGELLQDALRVAGIDHDYHHAGLERGRRVAMEERFCKDPNFRVLVGTSGLSQGLNMPARRVIVLGVHRGLSLVDVHEIVQEFGRAGRPGFDDEGDAYVLVPNKDYEKHVKRLKEPQLIESQMQNPKVLAFHLVSEIHHGGIKSIDDIHSWYGQTLAHFQKRELDEDVADKVVKHLLYSGCVREEDGEFRVTATGSVASMFYYSPFDVADLYRNLSRVFEAGQADHDLWMSVALANIDSHRSSVCNTAERNEMDEYARSVSGKIERALSPKQPLTLGALKAGYCYWLAMNGKSSPAFNQAVRGIQQDFGRTAEVMVALDGMCGKWGEAEFLRKVGLRVAHGVPAELADLCRLDGVGKVKAQKLWAAGLRELKDVAGNLPGVLKALNCSQKVGIGVAEQAKRLLD